MVVSLRPGWWAGCECRDKDGHTSESTNPSTAALYQITASGLDFVALGLDFVWSDPLGLDPVVLDVRASVCAVVDVGAQVNWILDGSRVCSRPSG